MTPLERMAMINAALVQHGAPEFLALEVAKSMPDDVLEQTIRTGSQHLADLLKAEAEAR